MAKKINDVPFEIWQKKFFKTKAGKIFNLKHELAALWSNELSRVDKPTHFAFLAWTIAENTKYEEDVREIIEMLLPEFFND